jgi:hypothetical protein
MRKSICEDLALFILDGPWAVSGVMVIRGRCLVFNMISSIGRKISSS